MPETEVTLGEIYRSVQRLQDGFSLHQSHVQLRQQELLNQIQAVGKTVSDLSAPIEVHAEQIRQITTAIGEMRPRVDSVMLNVAVISGGVTACAFLLNYLVKR